MYTRESIVLPGAKELVPTATVPDTRTIALDGAEVPSGRRVQLEPWLDLWIARRYAGGALPVTVDPTPVINHDLATLGDRVPTPPRTSLSAEAVAHMVASLGEWTGAAKADLAAMVGVRSTKTLYNWRDRPATVLRRTTQIRLVRLHALVRSIINAMGPLDGRVWLTSGTPSPLDLLVQGDIAAVEQRARAAGVRPGLAHRVLSPTEAQALRRGGLHLEPVTRAMRDDTSARTHALTTRLLSTGHTVDETACLLGQTAAEVRRRIQKKEIYAVEHDGAWLIPGFLLNDGRLVPHIDQVVPHIPDDAHIIEVYTWFTSPSPDLEDEDGTPVSPRDWLLAGYSPDRVVAQARDL
jgi:hypothetical protein